MQFAIVHVGDEVETGRDNRQTAASLVGNVKVKMITTIINLTLIWDICKIMQPAVINYTTRDIENIKAFRAFHGAFPPTDQIPLGISLNPSFYRMEAELQPENNDLAQHFLYIRDTKA
jgi:hypothetical protein